MLQNCHDPSKNRACRAPELTIPFSDTLTEEAWGSYLAAMTAARLDDFDFDLPRALIAAHPCEPRDMARLLLVPAAGDFADRRVGELPTLLLPGDLLVCNDTKVIPSRLHGRRGAARVEVTLSRDLGGGAWRAFAKGARRFHGGDRLVFGADLAATVAEKNPAGDLTLRFDLDAEALRAALLRHGSMPLPPYIRRPPGGDPRDREDYQTIFAQVEGAVAAPTAGLHFTPALLDALGKRGVGLAKLTLHVGPGTFLPVKTDDPRDHRMHGEWGVLSAECAARIAEARRRGGRIVAVGTTTLRLLESAAAETGEIRPFAGETSLFILPGYRFRAIDMLLTNFHLPRSTLFMLVAALAGLGRIKAVYAHAVEWSYRFYSYGDACLIERPRRDPPSGTEQEPQAA
jgi:S-adenosylmethionine:tRNA ribosyltransferase-isomerase